MLLLFVAVVLVQLVVAVVLVLFVAVAVAAVEFVAGRDRLSSLSSRVVHLHFAKLFSYLHFAYLGRTSSYALFSIQWFANGFLSYKYFSAV